MIQCLLAKRCMPVNKTGMSLQWSKNQHTHTMYIHTYIKQSYIYLHSYTKHTGICYIHLYANIYTHACTHIHTHIYIIHKHAPTRV